MTRLGEFQLRTSGEAGVWELWHKDHGRIRRLTWKQVQGIIRRRYDPAELLNGRLVELKQKEAQT